MSTDERANQARLLRALEFAKARLERRIDGNVDPSKESKLRRRYLRLLAEISGLCGEKGGWG